MTIRALRLSAMAAVALAGLSACNRSQSNGANQGAAAVADRGTGDGYGSASAASGGGGYRTSRYARSDRKGGGSYGGGEGDDRPPVPLFHGEPMWSENRAHSAKENAEYHFERAGADLGSQTLDDFLTKVHRFCDHPPAGAQTLTRSNGDRLLYDPKSNLFAVVTREGAPRTVFKPNDGLAYWNEQKAQLAEGGDDRGSGYGRRSYQRDGGGDNGGRSRRYGSGRSESYGDDRSSDR